MDITEHTSTTVFTDFDDEGNEAVLNEAMAFMKQRERKFTEAEYHHNKALEIMENVWKKYSDEQAMYQTKNRSMFERFDVLGGDYYDDLIKRDQW
jgi:hypothetical protein